MTSTKRTATDAARELNASDPLLYEVRLRVTVRAFDSDDAIEGAIDRITRHGLDMANISAHMIDDGDL